MAGSHPNEIDLLEYVEGDLGESEAAGVREHLATCPACSASVAELERARGLLRASPILELPEVRRRRILESLPEQERERRSLLASLRSPRRLALVLAPAAVAAGVAAAVISVTGNGPAERQAGEVERTTLDVAAAEEAAPPAEPPAAVPPEAAAAEGGPVEAPAQEARAPLTAAGTPGEVAAFLRERGFEAEVVDGTVEVAGAQPEAVAKALEELGPGPVSVVVRPAG